MFVCLTNPAKFDKNLRLAFLLSAAPLPSPFICLLQSLSNLSTPFNLSASLDICSSLHFLHFCLLPTFRPAISFPPLRVVVLSSRSGDASPRVQLGRRRWEGWSKKTLSSPLHTGLRDETSAAADGWSSSERRARCSSCQAKERNLFKVCCCFFCVVFFFFCLCFEKKTKKTTHPPSQTRIPARLIRDNVMNDECAGERDDPPSSRRRRCFHSSRRHPGSWSGSYFSTGIYYKSLNLTRL